MAVSAIVVPASARSSCGECRRNRLRERAAGTPASSAQRTEAGRPAWCARINRDRRLAAARAPARATSAGISRLPPSLGKLAAVRTGDHVGMLPEQRLGEHVGCARRQQVSASRAAAAVRSTTAGASSAEQRVERALPALVAGPWRPAGFVPAATNDGRRQAVPVPFDEPEAGCLAGRRPATRRQPGRGPAPARRRCAGDGRTAASRSPFRACRRAGRRRRGSAAACSAPAAASCSVMLAPGWRTRGCRPGSLASMRRSMPSLAVTLFERAAEAR
jgi:hypothetical protein